MTFVGLGYCGDLVDGNEVDSWLESRCGGLPGWLRPPRESLQTFVCAHCKTPLIFVLQVYSPRESVHTFHRMLYVFACWHCGKTVRCFRQVASKDYGRLPLEPDDISGPDLLRKLVEDLKRDSEVCDYCLIPCDEKPVAGVRYHQHCLNYVRKLTDRSPVLKRKDFFVEEVSWKEYFIETTQEVDDDQAGDLGTETSLAKARAKNLANQDQCLDQYIEIMNKYPGHVIAFGGPKPIWFCSKDQLVNDPPNCEHCGTKRTFEFQVQSSVVDKVGLTNDLEFAFGVLAVYTCPDDCVESGQEFIYKQRDPTIDVKLMLKEDYD